MTTYVDIAATQTDADSYVDTNLIDALKNNVLAMFEGDASASAVRLQGDAIADSVITSAKFVTPTNGTSYRHVQMGRTHAHNVTSLATTGLSIAVPRTGVYQISYEMRPDDSATTGYARVYKNAATTYTGDAAIGTEQSRGSSSFAEFTESSISLNAGDVITLYSRIGSSSYNVETRNFTLESAIELFGS